MATFIVRWEIELSADSPENAARIALEIQRDNSSLATQFDVREVLETTDWVTRFGPTVSIDFGSSHD